MWISIIGFGVMFFTALANKLNKDEIKQSMALKRCVIVGIIGGFTLGVLGIFQMLFG